MLMVLVSAGLFLVKMNAVLKPVAPRVRVMNPTVSLETNCSCVSIDNRNLIKAIM